ncbi:MAG: uroporphyrinogen-III C-methyltransferase [Candidatus Methylomirabilales bacterium]
MGFVRTIARLAHPRGEPWEEVPCLVDTGSFYVIVPPSLAERLGLVVAAEQDLWVADGRGVRTPLAMIHVTLPSLPDRQVVVVAAILPTPEPLLGVTALEGLGVTIDPVTGQLAFTRAYGGIPAFSGIAAGAGKVYLVGAGPGDPGLMTVKGLKCLKEADVVVYDHLVDERLLSSAKAGAKLHYVGKQAGEKTLPQEEINRLLIEQAKAGNVVVRLKGGDPFIFGRGGEEAEALAKAGIPFEVVPGVTSAIAVPAYAGIPLTHRGYASSVAFLTGHEDPTKGKARIAWEKIAAGIDTLVFLMGAKTLPEIVKGLLAHGKDPKTPVAVIRWGTRAEQETIEGTLEGIAEKAKGLTPPAIAVIGEVVKLRGELRWFEQKPLFGLRVLVTRAREQASAFASLLEAYGAEVVAFPTIEILPPESFNPLDQAIAQLDRYHWILFTSANGFAFFLKRLLASGRDLRALAHLKIGAIGPGTASALKEMGLRPDLVPSEFVAEAFAEALSQEALQGLKILLPRAEAARDVLPQELRRRGADVDVVPAYRTAKASGDGERLKQLLVERKVHLVTFTSSSTVANLAEMLKGEDLKALFEGVTTACIGPITAQAAEKLGLNVHIVPPSSTIPAFVEAIVEYFRSRSR